MRSRAKVQAEGQDWLTLDFFKNEFRLELLKIQIPESLVTEERLEKLYLYTKEVELWNRQINLVGQFNRDFVSLHLLDSLSALPHLLKLPAQRAADVGSGAGLPGIPLAIFMDHLSWTLIERSGKRAGFLRNVILSLNLSNRVSVIEESIERVEENYDLIVFRAFRSFTDFFIILKERLNEGGHLAAYKGKSEKIHEEIEKLNRDRITLIPLQVPHLDQERHLLVYER